jgi:hypothetical protein
MYQAVYRSIPPEVLFLSICCTPLTTSFTKFQMPVSPSLFNIFEKTHEVFLVLFFHIYTYPHVKKSDKSILKVLIFMSGTLAFSNSTFKVCQIVLKISLINSTKTNKHTHKKSHIFLYCKCLLYT